MYHKKLSMDNFIGQRVKCIKPTNWSVEIIIFIPELVEIKQLKDF